MTDAVFLGTGNFLAPEGRYWNSFVLEGTVLVEPSPTALPHLRMCGLPAGRLRAVVISHFHPDHTFGWPFLLLELVESAMRDGTGPLYVGDSSSLATCLQAALAAMRRGQPEPQTARKAGSRA